MVNITNDLGLGWWDVADPNHQTGQHVITAPEPAQISAAPSAGPVPMDTIAATMVAPVQSAQSNGQGKGGLIGLPPPIFDGNRAKSDLFLDKFLGYELLNGESRTFQVPYLKTALCLSYIVGPNVDAWANAKRRWLRDQVKVHGVPQTSDMLWDSFEHDFRAAYIDSDAKLNALQKFQELKMIGGDIDSYIATFDRLREESGYREDDLGAIVKFREGLPPKLLQEIITHNVPAPTTMNAWKKKARERQTVYKELRNVTAKKPFPVQQLAQYLGLRNYQPTQRPAYGPKPNQGRAPQTTSQVVPMDVDAGNTGRRFGPGQWSPERQDLYQKGACFTCKAQGHVSHDCPQKPKKLYQGQSSRARAAEVAEPKATISNDEALKQIGGLEGVLKMLPDEPEEVKIRAINALQDFYQARN
jgi:Retrotransposon gag protein/Zinc knuckle